MDCTVNVYSYLAGFAVCFSAYVILTNDTNYKCYIKTVKLAKQLYRVHITPWGNTHIDIDTH